MLYWSKEEDEKKKKNEIYKNRWTHERAREAKVDCLLYFIYTILCLFFACGRAARALIVLINVDFNLIFIFSISHSLFPFKYYGDTVANIILRISVRFCLLQQKCIDSPHLAVKIFDSLNLIQEILCTKAIVTLMHSRSAVWINSKHQQRNLLYTHTHTNRQRNDGNLILSV